MNQFHQARSAEIEYHEQFYEQAELFAPGTWLAKPVQVVLDCLEELVERERRTSPSIRVLDLACGVGRNSIPIAQRIAEHHGSVVCVDVIPSAIDKLMDNAKTYGVDSRRIEGVVADVEHYMIQPDSFDYIVSGQHMRNRRKRCGETSCSISYFGPKNCKYRFRDRRA